VRRSIANLAPFYVMDSRRGKSCIHQKSSIPKSTGAGNERAATRSWTGSQERVDSMESVHLKFEQRSHGFFQVGGFLFVFFAFPFQLGEQVLHVSWHTFANRRDGIHWDQRGESLVGLSGRGMETSRYIQRWVNSRSNASSIRFLSASTVDI